ncbi:MAG: chemotaxis response regulator protein-glutamate methylesterase [Gammaproteobacteria bacterium]|nr:chemotaxis response regulator protein-glutamate methylesterase [Gammaproteobacteria bacterium]
MLNRSLKILVVDDSAFFRHRIADVIETAPDMQIIGYAADGQDAIKKAKELRPDLITMDVQMPGVDGISAVRSIMAECPTRIVMLSALTRQGAQETLEALEAGAIDFLSKEPESLASGTPNNAFGDKVLVKLRAVGHRHTSAEQPRTHRYRPRLAGSTVRTLPWTESERPRLIVIGASTGGPVALQTLLSQLPREFPLPMLVAVHMPGGFTSAYAERLNTVCAIQVREATDHMPLMQGQVLIAPGGKQMIVEKGASGPQVRIRDALPSDVYHPSVDQLFVSAAQVFGSQLLGVILTGMGSDGLKGSQRMKSVGAQVWSQNEESCVVYGMPHAIVNAGLSDCILSIEEMGQYLIKQL